MHQGNVTIGTIVDERATPQQRGRRRSDVGRGGPGDLQRRQRSRRLDFLRAVRRHDRWIEQPVSRGNIRRGRAVEDYINPVKTAEELRLLKPTGFTSKWADSGKTETFRIATPQMSYDHSGQYGEFSEFDYSV